MNNNDKNNMNNNDVKNDNINAEKIMKKLEFIHKSQRNVLYNMFRNDKLQFNYNNAMSAFYSKNNFTFCDNRDMKHTLDLNSNELFGWLNYNFHNFSFKSMDDDYIYLTKNSIYLPSGNSVHLDVNRNHATITFEIKILRSILQRSLWDLNKELREASKDFRREHKEFVINYYGERLLKQYKQQIHLIEKAQKEIEEIKNSDKK